MAFISARCPNCSADIQIPSECNESFCAYCGNKVIAKAAIAFYQVEMHGSVQVKNQTSFQKQIVIMRRFLDKYLSGIPGSREIPLNANTILMKMQALDPENEYYHLFYSILAFCNKERGLEFYAAEFSEPSYVCSCEEVTHGKFLSKSHERIWRPHTYPVWRCGSEEMYQELAGFPELVPEIKEIENINNWIESSNAPSLVKEFVHYFIGMIMDQGDEIENGIIRFPDSNSEYRYTYQRMHRKDVDLCIADNIIEYFIPYLQEEFHAKNKQLLIDALLEECKRYPNSHN